MALAQVVMAAVAHLDTSNSIVRSVEMAVETVHFSGNRRAVDPSDRDRAPAQAIEHRSRLEAKPIMRQRQTSQGLALTYLRERKKPQ